MLSVWICLSYIPHSSLCAMCGECCALCVGLSFVHSTQFTVCNVWRSCALCVGPSFLHSTQFTVCNVWRMLCSTVWVLSHSTQFTVWNLCVGLSFLHSTQFTVCNVWRMLTHTQSSLCGSFLTFHTVLCVQCVENVVLSVWVQLSYIPHSSLCAMCERQLCVWVCLSYIPHSSLCAMCGECCALTQSTTFLHSTQFTVCNVWRMLCSLCGSFFLTFHTVLCVQCVKDRPTQRAQHSPHCTQFSVCNVRKT